MMKNVIVVLFFVPVLLFATGYCDYFTKNNDDQIIIRTDYLDDVVKMCSSSDSSISYISIFCDSLLIGDNFIEVTGDYSQKLNNICFNKPITDAVGTATEERNWFVDFLVRLCLYQEGMPHWRR
jgi:hypothetical protein